MWLAAIGAFPIGAFCAGATGCFAAALAGLGIVGGHGAGKAKARNNGK